MLVLPRVLAVVVPTAKRLGSAILACVACAGSPALAVTGTAQVNARVVKPLTRSKVQDLDLGTMTLGPGTWSNATIQLTRTGTFACAANVTCTGATQVAIYNVQGSNQQTVQITAPSVTLTNQSDPTKTLTLTVDNPGSIPIPNSGQPGVNFSLGGSITVNSTTAVGVYSGTFNVTVDYQ